MTSITRICKKPQRVSPLRFFAWSAALGALVALVGAAVLVGLIGPAVLIGAIALVVLGIVVHDEASFDWFGDSMAAFAEIIHKKAAAMQRLQNVDKPAVFQVSEGGGVCGGTVRVPLRVQ